MTASAIVITEGSPKWRVSVIFLNYHGSLILGMLKSSLSFCPERCLDNLGEQAWRLDEGASISVSL
jgi:hypothetical protein